MTGPGSKHSPAVLVVDDVRANLVAFEALLADVGCTVVLASSGNQALKELIRKDFAVMLLDVQMPEMDGYEVAKYARGNPSTRHVPIIFLTAMPGTEDTIARGYGSGAVDFLLKPINPYILRSKVEVFVDLYLGRRRLADEVEAHRKTLADLQVANGALRHFTHAASHDLKEPLRAVRGFLQALLEDAGDLLDARAREHLDRSRNAAERMVSLLDSLLAYAGLQNPVAWTAVDCQQLLEDVGTDLGPRLAAARATLVVEKLPSLVGDRDRLYQLFLNLVGNAIKFSRPDEPPQITVTGEERDGETLFCVADNGIGIPEAKHLCVFDPFQRLHARRLYEGSGLGLTICQQIVEQHAGRIWVESVEGQGSRFHLAFPVSSPPPS